MWVLSVIHIHYGEMGDTSVRWLDTGMDGCRQTEAVFVWSAQSVPKPTTRRRAEGSSNFPGKQPCLHWACCSPEPVLVPEGHSLMKSDQAPNMGSTELSMVGNPQAGGIPPVSRSRQPPGECCNPAEAAGESPRSIGIPCVISLHSTAWHRTYSLLVCVFRLQKLVEKNATTWSCTAHRSAAVGTITARNHRQLRRIFFSPTGLSESALR